MTLDLLDYPHYLGISVLTWTAEEVAVEEPTVGSIKYRLEPQDHTYLLGRIHRTYRLDPQSRTYTAGRIR